MSKMPTGIFTRSKRVEAVVMRDNAEWDRPSASMAAWRYEVCFAKQLGIGRNGAPEFPFGSSSEERTKNTDRMREWCDKAGIEVYHIFPSGVGFPNEQDQLLCFLAWR